MGQAASAGSASARCRASRRWTRGFFSRRRCRSVFTHIPRSVCFRLCVRPPRPAPRRHPECVQYVARRRKLSLCALLLLLPPQLWFLVHAHLPHGCSRCGKAPVPVAVMPGRGWPTSRLAAVNHRQSRRHAPPAFKFRPVLLPEFAFASSVPMRALHVPTSWAYIMVTTFSPAPVGLLVNGTVCHAQLCALRSGTRSSSPPRSGSL